MFALPFDYTKLPKHQILCIDMKSFYASAEAAAHGLDPIQDQIAVVGDLNRSGSVVLAASPALKKRGIRTGSRLYQIPNDSSIYLFKARMQYYLDLSICVTDVFGRYVPPDAIHTYSVDEAWLTLDGTSTINGTPREAALNIQSRLSIELGLPSAIAFGPNKFIAKIALDNYAKKSRNGYIELGYEHIKSHFWPLPVQDIWGIGSRMQRHLKRMGIRTLGDIAAAPLNTLKLKFGVMGEQLYYHAWGIDLSPIFVDPEAEVRKGISHGVTLMRDYSIEEGKTIIYELADLVSARLRKFQLAACTVSIQLKYSHPELIPTFKRSITLTSATNLAKRIYDAAIILIKSAPALLLRYVGLGVSNLLDNDSVQIDLFNQQEDEKLLKLSVAIDSIRNKFGTTSIARAVSYTDSGVLIDRSGKIGGHTK